MFYNGITHDDINNTSKMGMEPWAKHGIGKLHSIVHPSIFPNSPLVAVGRGVLIDIWNHLGQSYDPFTTRPITLQEILECAKAQSVTFQYGDILIIRSGWVDRYLKMDQEDRIALGNVVNYAHNFVGVEQTEEVLDFLHDNYFSAVAGDQPGFEAWPPPKDCNLHGVLLPLWGMPIGEMWDLEELSQQCKARQQYTFFFASTPANVAGKSKACSHDHHMCLN